MPVFPNSLITRFRMPQSEGPEMQAFRLIERIASPLELEELKTKGGVLVVGEYANYIVVQNGGTWTVDENGERMSSGCMGIFDSPDLDSPFAPVYPMLDQFIVNFLVVKSDERLYWNTACISRHHPHFENPRDRINKEYQKHGLATWIPKVFRVL